MTQIAASAPGKLVLTGEYAVLEGAPALVIAIDRRARVTLEDGIDDDYRIDAPDLGIIDAHCRVDAEGRAHWFGLDESDAARLALAAAVIEAAAVDGRPAPFRARLDTQSFFCGIEGGRAKLGFGSSAALTVALAGAIRAHDHRAALPMDALIETHRRAQCGRGSGLDIAASLTGGAMIYRRHDDIPRSRP
ncbi:MAG: mevalonate kinase family protein, partial [Rhodanobacteraceae bacterium]